MTNTREYLSISGTDAQEISTNAPGGDTPSGVVDPCTELTRLRTLTGQLQGQIKLKDMQIAELKKTPAQRAQERDELELQEAWERIDSDLTREQQCRDEMMGGHL